MSGSPGKIVPEINLDEFEKRLRAAGAPSAGNEDPLAELTRLVNSVHADARRAARTPQSEPAQADDEPAKGLPLASSVDVRPAFAETESETEYAAEAPSLPIPDSSELPQLRASRGWGFKVTGMIVVGVALLGAAAALKHGVPGLPKAPPFIAADDAPTKVQPPSDATVQTNGDIAALLMKDSATPTPVKVVNTEEQPVDLRTQTQPPAPAPSASASPPNAVAPAPTVAVDAVSPVATAPETQIVPPAAASASVAPLFPVAKPVKTVSVRPDGTLIAAADAAPPGAAPAPDVVPTPPVKVAVRAVDPVVATPEAATPKLDLPTKLSPKSQQRIVAKTDTTAPDADASATPSAPAQLVAPPKSAKPAKLGPKTVAEASAADSPPADVTPAASAAPAVATPAPKVLTAAAEGGGEWAVQLAAPRSEADARSAVSKLKNKYADALGDSALSIHQADVKGQTIYRVRVGGLSKADASALCSKLKAGGGDCFIAKD
jgi:cell division septation protein DedD